MNEEYEKLKSIVNGRVSTDSKIQIMTVFAVEDKELMADMCKVLNEHGYLALQFKEISSKHYYLVAYGE